MPVLTSSDRWLISNVPTTVLKIVKAYILFTLYSYYAGTKSGELLSRFSKAQSFCVSNVVKFGVKSCFVMAALYG